MSLCRYSWKGSDTQRWGWHNGQLITPVDGHKVAELFAGQRDFSSIDQIGDTAVSWDISLKVEAPLFPEHEVWAAGVTYESSKLARMAESAEGGDFYARVYTADRPEIFLKATPRRVSAHGEPLHIRSDSAWNVPEPELALVVAATGKIIGYTVGNDMSSRDIEGANPLYLPQAKVYRRCCGLGPGIVPADGVDVANLRVFLQIFRDDRTAFEGETSTSRLRRSPSELVDWLFRHNDFPSGVVLLTGTGIIPPDDFTLQHGDLVNIFIDHVGVLSNPIEVSEA